MINLLKKNFMICAFLFVSCFMMFACNSNNYFNFKDDILNISVRDSVSILDLDASTNIYDLSNFVIEVENPEIAKVNDNFIIGVSSGETIVSVKFNVNNDTISDNFILKVGLENANTDGLENEGNDESEGNSNISPGGNESNQESITENEDDKDSVTGDNEKPLVPTDNPNEENDNTDNNEQSNEDSLNDKDDGEIDNKEEGSTGGNDGVSSEDNTDDSTDEDLDNESNNEEDDDDEIVNKNIICCDIKEFEGALTSYTITVLKHNEIYSNFEFRVIGDCISIKQYSSRITISCKNSAKLTLIIVDNEDGYELKVEL